MSDGYYSSKKTDDICEEVCGQVQILYQFCICSIFKLLTSLLKILGYLNGYRWLLGNDFSFLGLRESGCVFFLCFV